MTDPVRSSHLTVYGLVGVAMHLVIGVLVIASYPVIPAGGMALLVMLWLAGAVLGAALWRRTVWIPLLASLVVAAVWMTVFSGSR